MGGDDGVRRDYDRSMPGRMGAGYSVVTRHGRGVEGVQGEVVVGAVHVMADQPPCSAADEDVGGEVLVGEDAADADASGHRPRCERASRGIHRRSPRPWPTLLWHGWRGTTTERAGAEEAALCVIDVRAVAKEDELDGFADSQTVDESLAGQEAGFVGLRGVGPGSRGT